MKGVTKDLKPLIEWARANGWEVKKRKSNHIGFTKKGCQPVFSGATLSDRRAVMNVKSELMRSERNAS